MEREIVMVDGNEAAAFVAHATNEVIAIYPITPASPMGELADAWSTAGRTNILGNVPDVIEMQSEGGAAGTVHGALQAGALATTFTASQGLLLMIPNMFKIAGELTPSVFHVAARSIATHALSIFGDHSDVMAVRSTGWTMLCSGTVQEAQDLALIAQATTLESRVPVVHFFDGFRTSHELSKIERLAASDMRAMIDQQWIDAHRKRALDPNRPVLRGSAQNPDVFFQAREAANMFYDAVPNIVQRTMDRFTKLVGRSYSLFDYFGPADAERVIVIMGSGRGAIEEAADALNLTGERVSVVQVRLFRPFSVGAFIASLPSTVRSIAVLDRTKEPGAIGEPLYQDVVTALVEGWSARHPSLPMPRVIGGRFGLSSKEFTPAMAVAVFKELQAEQPKRHFTIGIYDDVTNLSLKWDSNFSTESAEVRAILFGLGSDGTVGACKNTVKLIGENTSWHAQGYFVYDSKKAGSVTISHLRFSQKPLHSTYLIARANFIACHQFHFLERMDILATAETGAIFLLNSIYGPEDVWEKLPLEVQQQILDKQLRLYVIDANRVASAAGLGNRINTVMQTCFFALVDIFPREEAIGHIKEAIRDTYQKRGEPVLQRNNAAVDGALSALHQVALPVKTQGDRHRKPIVSEDASDFVKRVTSLIIAGQGDLLPVSALPVDGTFPTGTAKYERRSIAQEIPIWDADLCIQCGLCALVCPHAAIRSKVFDLSVLERAPASFLSRPVRGQAQNGQQLVIQVAPDDCTGCGVCVDVCPARSKEVARHKAINMQPKLEHLDLERERFDFYRLIPEIDRSTVDHGSVKGSQLLEPLFEFSGACAGCGETPYLKLLTQLYGDRLLIANATGCSSIYGGNLPTTPWSTNAAGRGPAWSNSLFEDNAEFGLGMRLAVDHRRASAEQLLQTLEGRIDRTLCQAILSSHQDTEAEIDAQRARVAALQVQLRQLDSPAAGMLDSLANDLVRQSVWIIGGDGWAYDIGFGGLDHVLASGQDVNVLVLDTGVYSNTGGQASKATPRAAVAKFAAAGRATRKKDLGMIAAAYGNVYVAQIAMGANPQQTLRAFHEAESYRGPSLIIAYSHCIAHGIDMSTSMTHQKDAVGCGFWPLYHYDPRHARVGEHPFHLDSHRPKQPLKAFALQEGRFAMLVQSDPQHAEHLMHLAQEDINEQWRLYEQMAGIERMMAQEETETLP